MNLSVLKNVYNNLPQVVKSPLNHVPFSLFCGSSYRNQLKELNDHKLLTSKEQDILFEEKLISFLNDSITHVPFYRDYAKSKNISRISEKTQLFDFPLIEKEQVASDLKWFLDPRYSNKSYEVSTGGTTGNQLKLFMSNEAYGKEWAFVNDYLSTSGVCPNSNRLCLRGVDGVKPDKMIGYNPLYKELLLSPFKLTPERLSEDIGELRRFQPKWIHGYPSSVSELSRCLVDLGESINTVESILLVSEKLYSEQLNQITSAFDADILTFYGLTERVVFAPKYNDFFYPSRLYGATEEINNELVGTGFINKTTRLIRYKTGDEVSVKKDDDGFVDVIYSLDGRWGKEYLLGSNDERISMTALNIHSDVLDNVIKYQFFQSAKGVATIRIIPNSKFSRTDEEQLLDAFQSKVGLVLKFNLETVSEIPLSQRGKHRFIVTSIDK